ncbi:heme biosynthesis protein HemY [Methylovirgula sp. 4M-Z18]|uniref:heme biosynthesis protein HemY n=1 Tax=Methylovirgula sp. 4M-Z18 TaxID=2293567 RepID=UPI000E2EC7E6|nr:heme biosynthesis HemY N-terminal domain-containing protein [Methylovirgula sp. 4M-Z18]RFB78200.1 heme biosynthesis protein HemY [Methylovirgula sp. 4M-Z18]
MIRILFYLVILGLLAWCGAWLFAHDGRVHIEWLGLQADPKMTTVIGFLIVLFVALMLVWRLLRLILSLPAFVGLWSKKRRHAKGQTALARGMIAVGAGDAKAAQRHAAEAEKHLGKQPLPLLLKAQAAQLTGNRDAAEAAFADMLNQHETRVLGLRGLHVEARRRGDLVAAHTHAAEAHRIANLPWAGQAVLEHHTNSSNWEAALKAVDANVAARHLDKATAARQKAVLQTALALETEERDPAGALRLAREALKSEPGLVPAAALAGKLLARQGDLRRASKVLEAAWKMGPHPDLAEAYLRVRHGDSASDRLKRAETLSRLLPNDPEGRLTVAHAALDARDLNKARLVMAPLLADRPTVRACLMMADLEEIDGTGPGKVREWLARAARAPRDPAWIADGVAYDAWAPVSPTTGTLDAFVWRAPIEQLAGPTEGLIAMKGHKAPEVDDRPLFAKPAEEPKLIEAGPPEPAAPAEPEPAPEPAPPPPPAPEPEPAAVAVAVAEAPAPKPAPVIFSRPAPDDPGPQPEEAVEGRGKKSRGFLY